MSDLPESLYRKVRTVLDGHLTALVRCAQLHGAQQGALRAGDLDLLAGFATQAAHLLQRLEGTARHLDVITGPLPHARGPRASAIRRLLHLLAVESESAQARVRQFTQEASRRRELLVDEIRSIDGPRKPLPGRAFRPLASLPTFLDRSG